MYDYKLTISMLPAKLFRIKKLCIFYEIYNNLILLNDHKDMQRIYYDKIDSQNT